MSRSISTALILMVMAGACRPAPEPMVHSHLQGLISLSDQLEDSANRQGFEVMVTHSTDAALDTLGFAVTDSSGYFALDVKASERGIYPLSISRGDELLTIAELVVVDGDSARLSGTFPLINRRLRITSAENAAWSAYRNAKAQYNRSVLDLAQSGTATDEAMAQTIGQTSSVLWSLRTTFPGTFGAELSETESLIMLEGWNDSLLVERFGEIPNDHVNMLQIVRAARRGMARLSGQEAALDLIRGAIDGSPDELAAGLRSEIVLAHTDSQQTELALAATEDLRHNHPGSEWVQWADRADYELTTLMPGMEAPTFSVSDIDGGAIETAGFAGRYLILEYFDPRDEVFQRELPVRTELIDRAGSEDLAVLSMSILADSLIVSALLEGRDLGGTFALLPGGLDDPAARAMNVNVLTTRVLVNREGMLVGKYIGAALEALASDVLTRIDSETPNSDL